MYKHVYPARGRRELRDCACTAGGRAMENSGRVIRFLWSLLFVSQLGMTPGEVLGQDLLDETLQGLQLNEGAVKLYDEGRYQKAVPLVKTVLTMRKKLLGPDHLQVAVSLNNLGMLYTELGASGKGAPFL